MVAEGVETETQRNYLKRLNCRKMQGISIENLPADEAKRFVKDRSLSYIAKDKPPYCANILIIDDEQFICDVHAEILENLGYHPTKIVNPLAGLDLINEIRAINSTVPCMVISGHKADAVRKALKPMEKPHNLLYGINYFLPEKPVKANDLKMLLDKILQ